MSNIVFGYDSSKWETTTGSHLKATESSVEQLGVNHFTACVNPDNKSVHWKLGNDKINYRTSNYQPDPRDAGSGAIVKKIKGKASGNANFVLGYDKVDYNWKKGAPKEELDMYTERFVLEQQSGEKPDSAKPNKKNIVWGYDKPPMVSEAKTQFVNHQAVGRNSNEKQKIKNFVAQLKKSAVVFGHDKPQYTTTNKLPQHTAKQFSERSKTKKSNKSSIVLGYSQNDYKTTSKLQFNL